MIIKSHIRGGYRAAADYLKDIGKNEKIRLVHISDPDANNLDEAFANMWSIASNTKVKKPLHHISINPRKDERLTDNQVRKIIERAEQKYGYKPNEHQKVVVEHILDGRQHFHVIWNRVNMETGKTIWPGQHWNKSKQICREMEKELGLKRPTTRRVKVSHATIRNLTAITTNAGQSHPYFGRQWTTGLTPVSPLMPKVKMAEPSRPQSQPTSPMATTTRKGWPEAAIRDWEVWGHRNPRRFFTLWRELAP